MSVLMAFLLLWALTLGPATKAAVVFETQPSLWAESQSLLEPWANVTLTCQARQGTQNFQLLKNGVIQDLAHLGTPAMEYQFPLGAVTSDKRGLYRCRSGLDPSSRWSELSNLVEVTGAEALPPPRLSAEPVSWITPGLNATLLCQGGLRGVTFLLRREGHDGFLEVAETGWQREATFPIHQPGNYSCSYRTHVAGDPSKPSATVTIEELAVPPPPKLSFWGPYPEVISLGTRRTLVCIAPLSGVEFQLWQNQEELKVPMSSTSPERVLFDLSRVALGDGRPFTCRYRLRNDKATWSADSEPTELVHSDETLPAPVLTAELASQHPALAVEPTPAVKLASLHPAPGSVVRLRCTAPRAGLRFALQREDPIGHRRVRLLRLLRPVGPEAVFELRDVSVADSSNYSCVYVDLAPPFAGSKPSEHLDLRVAGPPPRPQLQALWTGLVPVGRDATLRCKTRMPYVTFELLRDGKRETSARVVTVSSTSADLVLTFVGPQHTGNYSCRYRSWWPSHFFSEPSDPVKLLVAGN